MDELTIMERALLEIVAEASGQYSWHNIASKLSMRDVPQQSDMMNALKGLAARGLLQRDVTPGSPSDRWHITGAGRAAIA